jgi:GNAT superfamily N-acetyltransferase
MAIHYRPASDYSLAEMADLYTRTFAAYFYAAIITPEDMARYVRVEQLDLDLSPVLCVDDEPVGLATLCRRGERVNCRGFGVTLPYRGRGLAHHLAQTMLDWASAAGATSLRLGVLVQNEGAVRTYLAAGLHVQRQLLSYEWREAASPSLRGGRGGWGVRDVQRRDPGWLLHFFDAIHPVPPIWTHEPISLCLMDNLIGYAIVEHDRPLAYTLIEPDAQGGAQIVDLAAPQLEQAVTLLRTLQSQYRHLVCSNEPDNSPVLAVFPATGFSLTHTRYDMITNF